MNYQTVILEFPNGKIRHIAMSEFDYYAAPNELEHKKENIIIHLDNLALSFIYETNDRGEIVNREEICSISFV